MGNKTSYRFGLGGWMFIQCALLVIHYGFKKTLPWWALWFPLIVTGSVVGVILLGIGVWIVIVVIID